jgi:hypothetical protein
VVSAAHSTHFTAESANATVRFTTLGNGNNCIQIDDVQLRSCMATRDLYFYSPPPIGFEYETVK